MEEVAEEAPGVREAPPWQPVRVVPARPRTKRQKPVPATLRPEDLSPQEWRPSAYDISLAAFLHGVQATRCHCYCMAFESRTTRSDFDPHT